MSSLVGVESKADEESGVDFTGPAISLETKTAVTGRATVTVLVTDPSGVTAISVTHGDDVIVDMRPEAATSVTVSVRPKAPGWVGGGDTITVGANDGADNSASKELKIKTPITAAQVRVANAFGVTYKKPRSFSPRRLVYFEKIRWRRWGSPIATAPATLHLTVPGASNADTKSERYPIRIDVGRRTRCSSEQSLFVYEKVTATLVGRKPSKRVQKMFGFRSNKLSYSKFARYC